MRKNLLYLDYLIRHKWYVLIAGLRLDVPLWRLILHDWSKLMPCEWVAYREFFYGKRNEAGHRTKEVKDAFKEAWLHHIHWNPHHWNHWAYKDTDGEYALEMPEGFTREMVADWYGAGRAITGQWRAGEWYKEHAAKIILHVNTKIEVEALLMQAHEEFGWS